MKSLLILTVFVASPVFAQAPWTVSRTENLEVTSTDEVVQRVPLQIMVDERSPWAKPGELKAQIEKASKIFRQCQIEFGPIKVSYVTYSPAIVAEFRKPDAYKGPPALSLAQGELSSVRPLMWLFGTQIPSTAQAFNLYGVGQQQRLNVDARSLLHTSVMTSHHCTNNPVPGADATYSTFAHELAHLLGDLPHINEMSNLMSEYEGVGSKSGKLNADQCKSIQQYSLINFSRIPDDIATVTNPSRIGRSPAFCIEPE